MSAVGWFALTCPALPYAQIMAKLRGETGVKGAIVSALLSASLAYGEDVSREGLVMLCVDKQQGGA